MSSAGIDSLLIIDGEDDELPGVHSVGGGRTVRRRLRLAVESRVPRLQATPNPFFHSAALTPGAGLRGIGTSSADVVNLHWINDGFLSIEQIGWLLARRTVVWTLHDMWPFCGSEHYEIPGVTTRHRTGYHRHNRPPTARGVDIDRLCWARKRRSWRHPAHLIAPSNWMAAQVSRSRLMRDWPVSVVANPLDVERYRPIERPVARKQLGLPQDAPILLYIADGGTTNSTKGFDDLIASMASVAARNPATHLVIVGNRSRHDLPRSDVPVHDLGYIDDDARLITVYGAADCVVVPSIIDNLPQVAVEAHACGRPVAAFRTGGLPDIVDHEVTGHLADRHDPSSLAIAINRTLEQTTPSDRLGIAARRRAEQLWSPRRVAEQYADIYRVAHESTQKRLGRITTR